jgi:dynactin-6
VIQPFGHIRAEGGPVSIGAYCIIAETAVVGLPTGRNGQVVLERGVSIENGAEVLARRVSEATEVGVKAKVGAGAVLGRFCVVAPSEVVGTGEEVGDFGVVFAGGVRRVNGTLMGSEEMRRLRVKGQEKMVEVLVKLIPDGGTRWRG